MTEKYFCRSAKHQNGSSTANARVSRGVADKGLQNNRIVETQNGTTRQCADVSLQQNNRTAEI